MNEHPTPRNDTDDVEGYGARFNGFDAGTDDVEGHGKVNAFERDTLDGPGPKRVTAEDSDDDVSGHLSGALGSKKKTEDAS